MMNDENFDIVSKWGANYFICKKEDYDPATEILFFGETKIYPGIKIKKIGEKERSSFEAKDFIQYEGVIYKDNVKYCLFSSTWDDQEGLIYRYCFAMNNSTINPSFLLQFNKTGQSCYDIDCTKVKLYKPII